MISVKDVLRNWRTTIAGVGAICAVLTDMAENGLTIDWEDHLALVMVALGLAAAKDGNKTGVG